jgi:hypothetical protein
MSAPVKASGVLDPLDVLAVDTLAGSAPFVFVVVGVVDSAVVEVVDEAGAVVVVVHGAVVDVVDDEVVEVVVDAGVVVDVVVHGTVVVVVVELVVVTLGTVHTNPFGSAKFAVKVTWVFQLSVSAPLLFAHAMPASHTPLAVVPLPV